MTVVDNKRTLIDCSVEVVESVMNSVVVSVSVRVAVVVVDSKAESRVVSMKVLVETIDVSSVVIVKSSNVENEVSCDVTVVVTKCCRHRRSFRCNDGTG